MQARINFPESFLQSRKLAPRLLFLDGLASFSLANLLLLNVWETIIGNLSTGNVERLEFFVAILGAVMLGGVFWLAALVGRLCSSQWIKAGLKFILVMLGLFIFWKMIPTHVEFQTQWEFKTVVWLGKTNTLILAGVVIIGINLLVLWKLAPLARAVRILGLLFSPFLLFTIPQSLYHFITWTEPAKEETPLTRNMEYPVLSREHAPRHRVLLLLFDELDYNLAFQNRPDSVHMPEFDRLLTESFSTTNAFPPAPHTVLSMPALFTGKVVISEKGLGRSNRLLTFVDGSTGQLKNEKTIYTVLREAGKTSLRLSGNNMLMLDGQPPADADFVMASDPPTRIQSQVLAIVKYHTIKLINQIPLSELLQIQQRLSSFLGREHQLTGPKAFLSLAEQVVAKADIDFAYIHFLMPHSPFIYDRVTNEYSTAGNASYLDNLVLTDRWLGNLRRAMEQNRVWDDTTVIITADHWNRTAMYMFEQPRNHRVPLIIKPAGRHEPLLTNHPLNTITLYQLIPALVRKDVSTPEQISTFLLRATPFAESPATIDLSF